MCWRAEVMKTNVRISNISIKNFKNVINGELSFTNSRKNYKASVLGLYGQNGSGKTALIDALELLKFVLRGVEIPNKFADYINVDSKDSEIEYSFDISYEGNTYTVIYSLVLMREEDQDNGNSEDITSEKKYKVAVSEELLRCQTKDSKGKLRLGRIIDTNTSDVFVPKSKYKVLVGGSKSVATDLLVSKKISQKTSKSFIFSKDLLVAIRNNFEKTNMQGNYDAELNDYIVMIESLVNFGNSELFVINTTNAGIISLNAQPFSFKLHGKGKGSLGSIALPIDDSVVISEEMYNVTVDVLKNMNIVLEQIIPGLTIGVKNLGNQLLPSGDMGIRIALVSKKNNREIVLKYESEGIKKILSILQLLVVVYNQSSITVAIDELDSGVFEYLLGEILKIISEKGKGQLIFTSHNLRPLETIDRGFVAFTTTNPRNRYIRLTNVKENNNLRDFYYRDIMLGEQEEEVYEPTNNSEIALAFREAGEYIGS
jgi:AAA15 family ATPase/GTPase